MRGWGLEKGGNLKTSHKVLMETEDSQLTEVFQEMDQKGIGSRDMILSHPISAADRSHSKAWAELGSFIAELALHQLNANGNTLARPGCPYKLERFNACTSQLVLIQL